MKRFEFIDHTADLAVKVYGKTPEEIFESAVIAWLKSTLNTNPSSGKEKKKLRLKADSLEELLVEFLAEINFFLLVRHWVTTAVAQLHLTEKNGKWEINAILKGEMFDFLKHRISAEIKAVTFHQMKIEKIQDLYQTTIIFDT